MAMYFLPMVILLDPLNIKQVFAVSFGELDISPITLWTLIALSAFIFLAVGISSLGLINSLLKGNDDS